MQEKTITVTVQIGNTDNKLTQNEWAHFCSHAKSAVSANVSQIHFGGGSSFDDPWQNACWVCELPLDWKAGLLKALERVKTMFSQDSIAVTFGETEFI